MQATFEYHKLLQEILDKGKHRGDRTGTGTLSIFDYKKKKDSKHIYESATRRFGKKSWKCRFVIT